MNAYRTATEAPVPPAGDHIEWSWVGWVFKHCSRCGASQAAVSSTKFWGVNDETETATWRHLRECSHKGK